MVALQLWQLMVFTLGKVGLGNQQDLSQFVEPVGECISNFVNSHGVESLTRRIP